MGDLERSDLLLDYCTGKLSRESAAQFGRHMSVCPECAALVAAQSEVWDALDDWEAKPVRKDFDHALYERIEKEGSGWRQWVFLRFRWKPALSVGAVCASAAVAIVLAIQDTRPAAQPPAAESPIETVEVEQAERALEDLEMLKQLSSPSTQNL